MARIRKAQGGLGHQDPPEQSSKHINKKSNLKQLKEQVVALGGDEDDYDLVKDVQDDGHISGPIEEDPALSKDVSKFLKGLNLSGKWQKPTESVKPRPPEAKALDRKTKNRQISKPEPVSEVPNPALLTKPSINPKSHFVAQPTAHWYTSVSYLNSSPTENLKITPGQLASLTSKAASLHTTDAQVFQTSSSSNSFSSEASFLHKILQSGTLSDRLSALTLLVQSSPLHNAKALETLKGMAERGKGKGGREESLKALRCIVDWWVGGGAPDRKLKYFRDQPLLHPSVTDAHLVVWFFEDWLKTYFFSILQILETLSLDPLSYVRTQALTFIFTLLRDKPEQEQNLLRLLVNKLGDMEKSLCSRSSYHLLQLLQSHPSMKTVIVREVISLVLRPPASAAPTNPPPSSAKHIRFNDSDTTPKPKPEVKKGGRNTHARYYATITFNQIVLTPKDRDVALQLIHVYFEMFKELLGERSENVDNGQGGQEVLEHEKGDSVDKKGRVRTRGNIKGKVKRKRNIPEIKGAAGFAEVEDVHSRLISAILTGVNRALPFAKIDSGDAGLDAHIDTLFLITHTSTFNISLQALVLIQQISVSLSSPSTSAAATASSMSKSIIDRYYRTLYSSLHDSRLATSSKQAMYLNLLFKSMKADPDKTGERVKAFVRRFVQVLVSGGGGATEFIAGGLFLLGELFAVIPGLRSMMAAAAPDGNKSLDDDYDPRKREPQFSHASSSPLWELTPLLHHYHPAISLHARQLLFSQPLTASPDLSLNTLSHFLDRFVYKNPKQRKANANGDIDAHQGKGSSAMQPAASGLDGTGVKLMKGEVGTGEPLMNDGRFLKKRMEDVPVDQLFFYKFFKRKHEKEQAKAAKLNKQKNRDEDDEDEAQDGEDEAKEEGDGDENEAEEQAGEDENDSDEDEAEIWKAMKATMPKMVGDEDLMEESDELPSEPDDDSEDLSSEDENNDGILSLAEGSDNEDLISFDGDLPKDCIDYDGSEPSEDDEWGGISTGEDKKRKRSEEVLKGGRRKKLRSLPTFASYENYAKMIEEAPSDDI